MATGASGSRGYHPHYKTQVISLCSCGEQPVASQPQVIRLQLFIKEAKMKITCGPRPQVTSLHSCREHPVPSRPQANSLRLGETRANKKEIAKGYAKNAIKRLPPATGGHQARHHAKHGKNIISLEKHEKKTQTQP